jgi:antitoxin (DNA-binding transcriptional repressor) of toxin-antitoxin stability system
MTLRPIKHSTIFKKFNQIKLWLENRDEIIVFEGDEPIFKIVPIPGSQPSDREKPPPRAARPPSEKATTMKAADRKELQNIWLDWRKDRKTLLGDQYDEEDAQRLYRELGGTIP